MNTNNPNNNQVVLETCYSCQGTGEFLHWVLGYRSGLTTCERCKGSGKLTYKKS